MPVNLGCSFFMWSLISGPSFCLYSYVHVPPEILFLFTSANSTFKLLTMLIFLIPTLFLNSNQGESRDICSSDTLTGSYSILVLCVHELRRAGMLVLYSYVPE